MFGLRPLKDGDPWKPGNKNGGGFVTSKEEPYHLYCFNKYDIHRLSLYVQSYFT